MGAFAPCPSPPKPVLQALPEHPPPRRTRSRYVQPAELLLAGMDSSDEHVRNQLLADLRKRLTQIRHGI